MGFFLGSSDSQFRALIDEVRRTIPDEYPDLKKQAQAAMPPGNKVLRVFLDGSYARGDAHEKSDIDIRVVYLGPASPQDVADALHGQLMGRYGVYDIHPQHQIAEGEQRRYAKKLGELADATRPHGIPPTPTTLLYFVGRLGIGAVVTALAYMAGRRLGYKDCARDQTPGLDAGKVIPVDFNRERSGEAEAEVVPTQPEPKGEPS